MVVPNINLLNPIKAFIWIALFSVMMPLYANQAFQKQDDFHVPLFKSFQGKIYVSTNTQTSLLGEQIILTIKGEELASSFEHIDWSFIKKYFQVEDIDIGFNRIRIRLYPFDSGIFTLPSQQAGDIFLPELTFQIHPNPNVSIQWSAPPSQQYPQQHTTWSATVHVTNPANTVALAPPHITDSVQVTLSPQSISPPSTPSSLGKTEYWAADYQLSLPQIFPPSMRLMPTPYTQVLPSPAVVINNASNQKWRFFDRPITVSVHPLPQFLPVNVTVGQLKYAAPSRQLIHQTGKLYYQTWTFTGHLSQTTLKQYLHTFMEDRPNTSQVEWLTHAHQMSHQWTKEGLNTTLTLQQPYRINQSGWFTLSYTPPPVFNPNTGKLEAFAPLTYTYFALPGWLLLIGQITGLCLVLIGLYKLYQWLTPFWLKRQLIYRINNANTPKALWYALQQWAQAQHNTPIHTLGEWAHWYKQACPTPLPETLIPTLNRLLYTPQSTHPSPPQQEWLTLKKIAQQWSSHIAW